MSYLASIYLAALALFGALIVWALPAMFMAFVDWTRAQVQAPKPSSSPTPRGEKPAALPALRAGEVSVH
jgi:hypothetical protein